MTAVGAIFIGSCSTKCASQTSLVPSAEANSKNDVPQEGLRHKVPPPLDLKEINGFPQSYPRCQGPDKDRRKIRPATGVSHPPTRRPQPRDQGSRLGLDPAAPPSTDLVASPPSMAIAAHQTTQSTVAEEQNRRSAANTCRDARPNATLRPGGAGPRQLRLSGRTQSPGRRRRRQGFAWPRP
ncbi:hypothetical protein D1007_36693 [Hordeum vulgare]|nr:hypothetical protein D1007_36693 [Hordeum vulgare]